MIFDPFKERLFYTVTDRYGGVSSKPYDSLNLALHVGDEPKNVIENRAILANKYNFTLQNLIYMEQTHSSNIAIIKDSSQNRIKNCDGLITDVKNIPIMVMVADCIPILFYEPKKHVIAVAHAGRNGTFNQISKKTIVKMVEEFGCCAKDIVVHLGVSIHECCYEVGEEIARVVDERYINLRENSYFLDLHKMNVDQLLEAGVLKEHIEVDESCSCCDEDYFSYRREGKTGRFAGVMKLHG
jgi:YfiH family protein